MAGLKPESFRNTPASLSSLSSVFETMQNIDERGRFIWRSSLVIMTVSLLVGVDEFVLFLVRGNEILNLVASLIVVGLAGGCLVSSRYTKTDRYQALVARFLLIATVAGVSIVMLLSLTAISSVVATMTAIILAMVLVGSRAAYATAAWFSALITYVWIGDHIIAPASDAVVHLRMGPDDLVVIILLEFTLVWLANYLANNLRRAVETIQSQAAKLETALVAIERKRSVGEEVSRRVYSVTAELNATAQEQARGSQQQVSTLAQVTDSVQTMTGNAQAIATRTDRLNREAQEIQAVSERVRLAAQTVFEAGQNGVEAVKRTISSNQQVNQHYISLGQTLSELEQQRDQIKGVVSLIKAISSETHLLALNAAIEAAGAGEYGERFNVVADEVKDLANRSLGASQQVNEILSQVEGRIQQAVSTAGLGQEQTQAALTLAQESGQVMQKLTETLFQAGQQIEVIEQAVLAMSEQTRGISQATAKQYSASSQTVESLQGIGTVALQTASSSAQVNRSAANLEELSQTLLTALAA